MAHKSYLLKKTGDKGSVPTPIPRKQIAGQLNPPEIMDPYFPDPDLVKAVNVALLLNRPLLVMGEPGCGKSLLAKDIAFSWYGDTIYTGDKFFRWNVKSTSKAKEGLYEFDYLGRLSDTTAAPAKAADARNYVQPGPLAKAMEASGETEKAVLLIDEIDKADIDFSNDLLNELEDNSFFINETGETRTYAYKPFIVITSNSEKDLSDAFLRRCVFHYIDLFSNDKLDTDAPKWWLRKIVQARYYDENEPLNPEADKAIDAFIKLRKLMNNDLTYRKNISTSEFLDWFAVLKKCLDNPSLAEEMSLSGDLNHWIKDATEKLPFGNAMFKTTKALLNLK